MDTGPLVAWLCPRDERHSWAQGAFPTLSPGCLICEAVIAEACHLVTKDGVDPVCVLQFVTQGRLNIMPMGVELEAVQALMRRYRDVPMDFADACVVRSTELHEGATVCTTDSDFKVYRRHGSQMIPLLAPWE